MSFHQNPATPTWADVAPVVEALCGTGLTSAAAVSEGAYSYAGRWIARWSSGRSAFVKAEATWSDDHGTGVEHQVYSQVQARAIPRLIGYEDGVKGGLRVLVTEDLSGAHWGVPLDEAAGDALAEALDEIAGVAPPTDLPSIASRLPRRWATFLEHPERLVTTGLASAHWLESVGPVLAAAERTIELQGDQLVHADLWLQNWCRAERGAVLVDWAGAGIANIMLSRAWGEAGMRAAGGPSGRVLARGHGGWAAWMAGQATSFHVDHQFEPPARLLETERREAVACLSWACNELDIPPPDSAPGFHPPGPWRP